MPILTDASVLLVIDIQRGGAEPADVAGIEVMDGYPAMATTAQSIVAAARRAELPVVFFQEVHRRSGVDFGRELDGAEGIHCVEGEAATELWPALGPLEGDYYIPKRRYSCFFGTELDILLKGLRADRLVLIGSLTDVCVHYTFVDAHQRDFHCRVVEDCVIGSSVERHQAALDAMKYLQRDALCTSADLVAELSGRVLTGVSR